MQENNLHKLDDVITKWLNDIQFRDEWRKNPTQALQNANMKLSDSDFQKIQAMLDKKQDVYDELEKKINK